MSNIKLIKLSAINTEKFISHLVEHASGVLTAIVGALNGSVPNYMLELDSYLSEKTMAFAAGKYDNNTTPITVETAKMDVINKESSLSEISFEEAKERLFPREEKKTRSNMRMNYRSQCEAIIA